jgi:hypothetical protein
MLRDNDIECNSTRTSFTIDKQFIPIGDGGIDLFGNIKKMNFIMQLKYKSPGYSNSPAVVREFLGTLHKQPEGVIGFLVSNAPFSNNARNIATNSERKIILCNNNNLIENLKLALKDYKKKPDDYYMFEELSIENIELETKDSNIFGIDIKGSCKINNLKVKHVEYKRFHPYF